jgi:hypothetical protein
MRAGFVTSVARFSFLVSSAQRGTSVFLLGGGLALAVTTKPNKSVKGTRRPLAVLQSGFLLRFGGFVSLSLAARPLL